jgi:hypothetical protein
MVFNFIVVLFRWWGCERSVVGLNFDFVLLNLTKHSSYLIFNASLYFSSAIQKEYYEKYGYGEVRCFLLVKEQKKKNHLFQVFNKEIKFFFFLGGGDSTQCTCSHITYDVGSDGLGLWLR